MMTLKVFFVSSSSFFVKLDPVVILSLIVISGKSPPPPDDQVRDDIRLDTFGTENSWSSERMTRIAVVAGDVSDDASESPTNPGPVTPDSGSSP